VWGLPGELDHEALDGADEGAGEGLGRGSRGNRPGPAPRGDEGGGLLDEPIEGLFNGAPDGVVACASAQPYLLLPW
jgi:hypothetical protein